MYYKDCLCPVTLSSQILIWLPLQSGGGFSFIFIFEFKREASSGKFSGKKCKYGKNIVKTRLTLILMSQKWLPPMRLVRLFSRQTLDGWSYCGGIMIMIIIITRPKPPFGRQGLAGLWGKDTVRWVHFGAFSTFHFAPRHSARIGY